MSPARIISLLGLSTLDSPSPNSSSSSSLQKQYLFLGGGNGFLVLLVSGYLATHYGSVNPICISVFFIKFCSFESAVPITIPVEIPTCICGKGLNLSVNEHYLALDLAHNNKHGLLDSHLSTLFCFIFVQRVTSFYFSWLTSNLLFYTNHIK